ncbi:MAG: glycosyltransferase family 4 protein, partial [Candidatus Sumerlaeia bacterium]|nr:glycosyltransferase family 4 protein [Candidatus Sumerlaeia bacterium]
MKDKRNDLEVIMIQLWPLPGNVYYTLSLFEGLDKIEGLTVQAWVSFKFPRNHNFKNIKFNYIYSPFNIDKTNIIPLLIQPFTFLWFAFRLFFQRAKILHINYTHPWVTVLYPFLRLKFKIVQTLHDIHPHPGEENLRNKLGLIVAKKIADVIIVHGQHLKDELVKKEKIPEKKIKVIPHGNMVYNLKYGDKDIGEDPETVLFLGRILPYKGLNILIEAFSEVLKEIPTAKLIIAGGGDLSPYVNALNKIANAVEVYNYIIDDNELANFFRRATIVAIPYIEGSQSQPLIQACTFGKAVVCTSVGCFREIIEDGVNGIVVEPGNVPQLA